MQALYDDILKTKKSDGSYDYDDIVDVLDKHKKIAADRKPKESEEVKGKKCKDK